jgi:hypothetical protein
LQNKQLHTGGLDKKRKKLRVIAVWWSFLPTQNSNRARTFPDSVPGAKTIPLL